MKKLIALIAGALIAGTALAEANLPKVDAEVRRVDTAQNKLALRHAEIPNLDMPPMSMVFQVADPKLLDGLKAGDKLMVTIDEIDGAYTVLSVEHTQP
ncbi:MAG: copper-binding protein [Azoarcus sp.]|nr:copper-binding protein [Azoarcus sp.]